MMKTQNIVLLIALLLGIVKFSFSQTDEEAIKATALDYIEGWYGADTVRMARALAPDLAKRGFIVNHKTKELEIHTASRAQMIEWTKGKPNEMNGNENLATEVQVIEIGENIAMVKTITPAFIDYIHMGKLNGAWKIYNVVWEFNKKKK